MITKIGFELGNRYNNSIPEKKNCVTPVIKPADNTTNAINKLNLNYFIPFTSKAKNSQADEKYNDLMFSADAESKELISSLKKEARQTGYNEITSLHVLKHMLVEIDKTVDKLISGETNYSTDVLPVSIDLFNEYTAYNAFSVDENPKKIQPVIKKYIKEVDNKLEKGKNKNNSSTKEDIKVSERLIDSIWKARNENEKSSLDIETIYLGALFKGDKAADSIAENLFLDSKDKLMINNEPMEKRIPFSEYEKKADNALKNLSLGTDVFVTYDPNKESPKPFLDTIKKVFTDKNDKNFTYTELSDNATCDFFNYKICSLAKDKSRQHIVALSPTTMSTLDLALNGLQNEVKFSPSLLQLIYSKPSNVKFLFYSSKDNYYTLSSIPELNILNEYSEVSIPSLNTKQMIKVFKENPQLMKDIQKPFSKNALEKTVEASAQLDGTFPQKTQNLIKKISNYYIDKKEITDKDVTDYIKEATNILKKDNNDNSIDIVFDTGKKISNMVGKSTTKKEASLLVKQIRANKMGTKGIILYSQDGSPGSGRKYTAKAIAGDAKVPYVEINAVDFGTKDVELFGGGTVSPEKAIKKLFSMVKAQAEANPNKSTVLFIENFEYFAIGELVSNYHQKAMAQLIREMEKADDEGLNILVAGSVADPELIGEATKKSFKFVDSIEVSSPAFNKTERAEVIEHTLKQNRIKLEGDIDEQKDIISYAADITEYFTFIELKNFIKKSLTVAKERGHNKINKSDLTEAFLQLTTGRPSVNKIEPHEKEIVTSHECGHAVNLEVMNNNAKTIGKPWHIPSKVNFITLDPRGYYGGAVYNGLDSNSQYTFETLFGDIVSSFGGNSAENLFYGINGSYGISADMKSVRNAAELMVKVMGLGAKTGKMAIGKDENLSDNMKKIIEDDERVIINNAQITSDMITEKYADFNRWFTEKYSSLVGSGECLVDGNEFRNALKKWKAEQTPEKQKELELCDQTIVQIMEATKKGIAVRKSN